MSVRNALVLFLALSTAALMVGCGTSTPTPVAPPSGGFTTSSLTGTYVFSTEGYDSDGDFLTMVGSFVATGNNGISSGTVDVVSTDPEFGLSPNVAMSNASYIISSDGRGQITFSAAVEEGTAPFILDFVLTSNSHGLITEFDSNGSGSGTLDLQPAAVSQSALSGLSYAFSIAGTGPSAPFATAGSLTLGATGGVTAGVEDFNNDGEATVDAAISTSSSVTVGTGTAPGAAQLVSSFGAGSYSYDVYAIDSTHLKFIESDGLFVAVGDAYTQGTSLPSGTVVFTMSGEDVQSGPLALAGFMPVSGLGVAGGAEDFNDAGNVDATPIAFSGNFSALTGGRSQLNLSGFENGGLNDVTGNYTFAAYPFTSGGVTGLQMLEIDGAGVTSGTGYLQTSTALTTSEGYGLNLQAVNTGSGQGAFEEDDIAEFQTTSTNFGPGITDINDEGQTSFGQSFAGTYQTDTTGEYTATTTEAGNPFLDFNFYAVNGSTFLILEIDPDQIGAGIFEQQNASGSPGAEPGISMPRPPMQARALRHKAK